MRICSVGLALAFYTGVALISGCCRTQDHASGDARSSAETTPRPANSGAPLKRLSEGSLQVASKSDCMPEIVGRIFVSPAGNEISEPKVRTAVESAQAGHENKPVLWIRFKASVDDLFVRLREKNPAVQSLKVEEFVIVIGEDVTAPVAHEGIMIVEGYRQHVRQDLVYRLPTHATGLELVIQGITLAKFIP